MGLPLAVLHWPLAAALGCYALALAAQWSVRHGGPTPPNAPLLLRPAAAEFVVLWLYLLVAAAVLAPLTRRAPGWRYAAANVVALAACAWLRAARTDRGFVRLSAGDVLYGIPADLVASLAPMPAFVSACDLSYWSLGRHGYSAYVQRAVELSDGSVLLVAQAVDLLRTSGTTDLPKLARLTPDGRPDPAFALGRGCPDVKGDRVVAGPNGTFSYAWRLGGRLGDDDPPRPDTLDLAVEWRDAEGRLLRGGPFPAAPAALPPWRDAALARPTATGFVVAGEFAAAPGSGRARTVAGVLADGRYDPAFAPWPVPAGDDVSTIHAWPDGHLLILTTHGEQAGRARLVRLGPDGREDASFGRRAAAALSDYGAPVTVAIDADGRPVVGLAAALTTTLDGVPYPFARTLGVVRLLPDGGEDPGFHADALRFRHPVSLHPQPSGHLVVVYEAEFSDGAPRTVRVDSAGRLDDRFRAALAGLVPLLVRRDGTLVVADRDAVVLLAPDGRELRRSTIGRATRPARAP